MPENTPRSLLGEGGHLEGLRSRLLGTQGTEQPQQTTPPVLEQGLDIETNVLVNEIKDMLSRGITADKIKKAVDVDKRIVNKDLAKELVDDISKQLKDANTGTNTKKAGQSQPSTRGGEVS